VRCEIEDALTKANFLWLCLLLYSSLALTFVFSARRRKLSSNLHFNVLFNHPSTSNYQSILPAGTLVFHTHLETTSTMKLFLSIVLSTSLVSLSAGFAPISLSNHAQAKLSSSTARNMFTGIVEEMGTVVNLEERDDMLLWDGSKGKGTELTVKGSVVLDGAYLG
jgi:hypothetical protein